MITTREHREIRILQKDCIGNSRIPNNDEGTTGGGIPPPVFSFTLFEKLRTELFIIPIGSNRDLYIPYRP